MAFQNSMIGGAWPFLVRGITCLLNWDNERDQNLPFERRVFIQGPHVKEEIVLRDRYHPSTRRDSGTPNIVRVRCWQKQVCDALRYPELHARDNAAERESYLSIPSLEGLGNLDNQLNNQDWILREIHEWGMPSMVCSAQGPAYVPAFCTHRPSLQSTQSGL